jgi:hypothetical protein
LSQEAIAPIKRFSRLRERLRERNLPGIAIASELQFGQFHPNPDERSGAAKRVHFLQLERGLSKS